MQEVGFVPSSEPCARHVLVTVSIVTWNSASHIVPCLESVLVQAADTEIIVVDNASQDETVDLVRRCCPRARIVVNPANVGFATAQVQAWEAARGRYWLLLNPDARLEPGSLATLAAFMAEHPRAGLVGPRLIDGTGKVQHCAQRVPSLSLTLLEASRLHRLLPQAIRGRLLLGAYFSHGQPMRVGWTWGTALLARREAVEAVGPLCTRFFMYGEDTEWCIRMRRGGWQVWFCPAAQVLHHVARSSVLCWSDPERLERILRGIYDAVRMHKGPPYVAALHAASLLALSLEVASSLVRSRPISTELRVALRYHRQALFGHGRQSRHPDA
jgi:GT2 family glycosyltransferase